MSRSIEVPDDVYTSLEAAAAAAGTTPVGWLQAKLAGGRNLEIAANVPPRDACLSLTTVELPAEVYRQLEEEALAFDTTPAEWIASQLPRSFPATSRHPARRGRTLADEFAGRVGLVASGRRDGSERVSEIFTEGMVEKHRAGTL